MKRVLTVVGVLAVVASVWLLRPWLRDQSPPQDQLPSSATAPATPPPRKPSPPPAPGLHGQLVDDFGAPVADAVVLVGATLTTRSDANGRFHVDPPRGQPLLLAADHPYFAPRVFATDLLLPAGQHRLDLGELELGPCAGLLVEVHDQNGAPVAAAEVRLRHALHRLDRPDFAARLGERTAHSGSDGVAVFYGVTADAWVVEIHAPGYASRRLPHRQPAAPEASPRLVARLVAGATLGGHLRDPGGEPLADARLLAVATGGDPDPPVIEARSDRDGVFRLAGLGRPPWRLAVVHASGRLLVEDLDGSSSLVDLRLPPGRSLAGQVLHGRTRRPVPGARVEVQLGPGWHRSPASLAGAPRALTDDSGKFLFQGLPAGIVRLQARSNGHLSALSEPLRPSLPDGDRPPPAVLLLPAGCTVAGRILSPTGLPQADAVIQPIPLHTGPAPTAAAAAPRAARSRADGGFQIHDLPAGAYRLAVQAPDRPTLWSQRFVAEAGGNLDLGPLRCRFGAALTGTARRADGSLAAGATVTVRPDPGPAEGPTGRVVAKVDADGHFRFPVLAPGRYRVFYDYQEHSSARALAAARAATRLRIELEDREERHIDLKPRTR